MGLGQKMNAILDRASFFFFFFLEIHVLLFIYLFIYDCVESSFLCEGFL